MSEILRLRHYFVIVILHIMRYCYCIIISLFTIGSFFLYEESKENYFFAKIVRRGNILLIFR